MISRRLFLAGVVMLPVAQAPAHAQSAVYYDYRYKIAVADLPKALAALIALRASPIMAGEWLPQNMLGTARDGAGNPVDLTDPAVQVAFRGDPGWAPRSVTVDGMTIAMPGAGDPGYWYVAIRSMVAPAGMPFDPATFGLRDCSSDESRSVLGDWA